MREHAAPFYLRRVKEALVTFPDPETGQAHQLFTRRKVQTAPFKLDLEEMDFVASNTREGRVMAKLFERIRQIEEDLDPRQTGAVFNVLGDVFPVNFLERMVRQMYARNQPVATSDSGPSPTHSPRCTRQARTRSAGSPVSWRERNHSAFEETAMTTLTIELPEGAFSALRRSPPKCAHALRMAAPVRCYQLEIAP